MTLLARRSIAGGEATLTEVVSLPGCPPAAALCPQTFSGAAGAAAKLPFRRTSPKSSLLRGRNSEQHLGSSYQQTGNQGSLQLLLQPWARTAYKTRTRGLHPFLETPRNISVCFPSRASIHHCLVFYQSSSFPRAQGEVTRFCVLYRNPSNCLREKRKKKNAVSLPGGYFLGWRKKKNKRRIYR